MRVLTISGSLLLAGACATVPDDAPIEFKNAEAAIERMEDQDAAAELPETADRAEKTFKHALAQLKDYRDGDEGASRDQAIETADRAATMAEDATSMSERIRAWDENETNLSDALAQLDSSGANVAVVEPTSPFARLEGSEIYSTLAFFPTGEATTDNMNENEVKSLAEILKKSPTYQVTLTGHADHRGESEFNQQLAQKRAENVAQKLFDEGISQEQVEIRSVGDEDAEEVSEQARLQLDRKVTAKLVLQ